MDEEFYVIQVVSAKEKEFISKCIANSVDDYGKWIFPQRVLVERKLGKKRKRLVPLYNGYIFLYTKTEPIKWLTYIKKTAGFIRILPSTDSVKPLPSEEKEYIYKLIYKDEKIPLSKVIFNENGRIEIKAGPLVGYEGRIVKVDKRKRRARVRLDLYRESHLIDFGFEVLKSI